MSSDAHVLQLDECTSDCTQLVGGKATGLGALVREGLQVPRGFVITAAAYREHVSHNRLTADLARVLASCATYEAQLRASAEIRALFEPSVAPAEIQDEILRAYARLSQTEDAAVAVRSSATTEDLAEASF